MCKSIGASKKEKRVSRYDIQCGFSLRLVFSFTSDHHADDDGHDDPDDGEGDRNNDGGHLSGGYGLPWKQHQTTIRSVTLSHCDIYIMGLNVFGCHCIYLGYSGWVV